MSAEVHERLHAALGQLAHRAGWSAFDADQHDTARNLFLVGLDAAIVAKHRDLRAHVLADIAAQHNHLGYPDDAVELVGVVEGDQRIGSAVRMVLYGVKARAHAAKGEVSESHRYLDLAEESYAKAAADAADGWQSGFTTAAHRDALTGHGWAVLARRTDSSGARARARGSLERAWRAFDQGTHRRPRALCAGTHARLSLDCGDAAAGIRWTHAAVEELPGLRSARLVRQLKAIRAAARAKPADAELAQLAADIDQALEPADREDGAG